MNVHQISAFIVASLLLLITPGPNLFVVLGRGISQGREAAIVAVFGFAVGDVVHTTFVVVGLSTLIESSIILFQIVKYFGSFYLIYLGVQAVSHQHSLQFASRQACVKLREILHQSAISNALNPSTALFFLVFFPQFINVEAGNFKIQTLILGVVFTVLGIVIYLPIAYFSGTFGKWLCAHTFVANKVHWMTGAILIGLGIWAGISENISSH